MLERLKLELEKLKLEGKLRECHPCSAREGGKIAIRGQRVTDFTSWDFLNVNALTPVRRALQSEVEQFGIGSCSSRLSSGTYPAHLAFEIRLARFLGLESCVLFSSTNQAVLSLLTAFVTERDCLIVDEREDTPLIDAAHLVGADVIHFAAHQPETLTALLERAKRYRSRFLCVESLSPHSGEKLDLAAILLGIGKSDTQLFVDESFALGVLGLRGAGGLEQQQILSGVTCVYGSLARGFGAYGAFVAGSRVLTNYLLNHSRTFRSENVLPACIAAALERIVDAVELNHAGREKLKALSRKLRRGLLELGLLKDATVDTPLICIGVSTRRIADEIAQALFQRRFLVEALSSGATLDQSGVVRMLLNVEHSAEDIDKLLGAVADVSRRV